MAQNKKEEVVHYIPCPKAGHKKHLVVCAMGCPYKGGNKDCLVYKLADGDLVASLVADYKKGREDENAEKQKTKPQEKKPMTERPYPTYVFIPVVGYPVPLWAYDADIAAHMPPGEVFELRPFQDAKAQELPPAVASLKAALGPGIAEAYKNMGPQVTAPPELPPAREDVPATAQSEDPETSKKRRGRRKKVVEETPAEVVPATQSEDPETSKKRRGRRKKVVEAATAAAATDPTEVAPAPPSENHCINILPASLNVFTPRRRETKVG